MADNRKILDDFKTNQDVKVIDSSVKLKVGIIGCGWIADAHIREYLKMPDVELVAFADLIPGKAEKFAKKHGVEVLAKLPIDPELPKLSDKGVIELFETDVLECCADKIEKMLG